MVALFGCDSCCFVYPIPIIISMFPGIGPSQVPETLLGRIHRIYRKLIAGSVKGKVKQFSSDHEILLPVTV